MFDDISDRYDFLNNTLSLGRHKFWREKAAGLVEPQSGSKVLDLCGGTGDFLNTFRKYDDPSHLRIIGDFSREMLQLSINKDKAFRRVQLDALKLPFRRGEFDLVLYA